MHGAGDVLQIVEYSRDKWNMERVPRALLACMVESCPDLAPGSSEQSQCAVENCQESLGGAMPAMALGPVLRGQCTALCPPF